MVLLDLVLVVGEVEKIILLLVLGMVVLVVLES
jgi:hypothetical protein